MTLVVSFSVRDYNEYMNAKKLRRKKLAMRDSKLQPSTMPTRNNENLRLKRIEHELEQIIDLEQFLLHQDDKYKQPMSIEVGLIINTLT